jgi:glycosyltransferase involved in cell wall biosynthesis
MKVAVFLGNDLRNYGGGEKDVLNWVSRLNDQLDITIYTLDDPNTENQRISKSDLPHLKIVWYKGKKMRLLKDIALRERIDVSQYDKVYSMCQGFLLNRRLMHNAKRFLLGIHNQNTFMKEPIESNKLWKRLFFEILKPIKIHYVKKADEIRVQNKDDERNLKEIGFKGKIWNVPPSMFDTTPEPLQTENFYVIWFNRVSPEKRPEELLEIAKSIPSIEFHAIGSGPLLKLFDDYNLPNVKKLGFLPEDELSEELRRASLCIITSRGETFGMSAIEAQAFGVPTLSYDVMGLRDYNEVVENREKMISRIKDYYQEFSLNRGAYLQMRWNTREKTLERFSNKVVLPQIKEMITK